MKAMLNGDTYIHGNWEKYNMYLVQSSESDKLEYLMEPYPKAQTQFARIRHQGNGRIFIDHPLNPTAALLESNDGVLLLVGKTYDSRFTDGINVYLELVCSKKYNKSELIIAE